MALGLILMVSTYSLNFSYIINISAELFEFEFTCIKQLLLSNKNEKFERSVFVFRDLC